MEFTRGGWDTKGATPSSYQEDFPDTSVGVGSIRLTVCPLPTCHDDIVVPERQAGRTPGDSVG